MKVNKFKKFLEEKGIDNSYPDDYDYEDSEEFDYESDINGDDIQHLLYLLRTMFSNSGIQVEIENNNLDIIIYCTMQRKERLKDIINVFDVANKLKKDILPQYDSEFEIGEDQNGYPVLKFNFYYEEGLYDDNMAF